MKIGNGVVGLTVGSKCIFTPHYSDKHKTKLDAKLELTEPFFINVNLKRLVQRFPALAPSELPW